jgi:hypothetical protein
VHAGVRDEVGGHFVEVHVQVPREAHRGRQVDQHARHDAVHLVKAVAAPPRLLLRLVGLRLLGGHHAPPHRAVTAAAADTRCGTGVLLEELRQGLVLDGEDAVGVLREL